MSTQLIESDNINEKLKNECALRADESVSTKSAYENELKTTNEKFNAAEVKYYEQTAELQILKMNESDLKKQSEENLENICLLERRNSDLEKQTKQLEQHVQVDQGLWL